jgi:hypothetical protein
VRFLDICLHLLANLDKHNLSLENLAPCPATDTPPVFLPEQGGFSKKQTVFFKKYNVFSQRI